MAVSVAFLDGRYATTLASYTAVPLPDLVHSSDEILAYYAKLVPTRMPMVDDHAMMVVKHTRGTTKYAIICPVTIPAATAAVYDVHPDSPAIIASDHYIQQVATTHGVSLTFVVLYESDNDSDHAHNFNQRSLILARQPGATHFESQLIRIQAEAQTAPMMQ
jgi:hypothetical protein